MSKRLSTIEEGKIADLYQQILEDMDAGSILGGSSDGTGDLGEENDDDYATGDQRIPVSIFGGNIVSRNGSVKRKKKKSKKSA
jgi:hypothetical protein